MTGKVRQMEGKKDRRERAGQGCERQLERKGKEEGIQM